MSILGNPIQKSPERAFTLQKYLLLHSQHDALQKNLDSLSANSSPTSSEASISPSSSPPRSLGMGRKRNHHRSSSSNSSMYNQHPVFAHNSSIGPIAELPSPATPPSTPADGAVDNLSAPPTRPQLVKRQSSLPSILPSIETEYEIEEEEEKLAQVNKQIKCTLTELLNCESVRGDKKYRMWIQKRLMDTEMELKGRRARDLSVGRRVSDAWEMSV